MLCYDHSYYHYLRGSAGNYLLFMYINMSFSIYIIVLLIFVRIQIQVLNIQRHLVMRHKHIFRYEDVFKYKINLYLMRRYE